MGFYRKKAVAVEAILWSGDNYLEIEALGRGSSRQFFLLEDENVIVIQTLEGDMRANLGDYIIKGVQGECYPCKPNIFNETYDNIL